jgi:hypothetical protein
MPTIPNVKATIVVIGSSSEPDVAGFGGSALFPALERFVEGIVNSPFMDAMQNAGYAVGRGHFDGEKVLLVPSAVPGGTVTDSRFRSRFPTPRRTRISSFRISQSSRSGAFVPPSTRPPSMRIE